VKLLSLKRRRDILRQKWQFVAVIVTVVLGVAMFAGTFNAYLNLGRSLEGSYERLAMADMIVTGADEGFTASVATASGVSTAIDRRQVDVPFDIGGQSIIGRVIGVPNGSQPSVNMLDVSEGRYLSSDDPLDVMLESHAAADFEVGLGDTLTIAGQEATVVAIVVSPEYLWPARDEQSMFTAPKTFAVVFADEEVLESLDAPLILDQTLVLYDSDADRDDVDSTVEGMARSANASATQPLANQPSNNAISTEIAGLQSMAVAFPVLFLAAAGMAIYVLITRLVFSQRGVIGTLRSLGVSNRTMSRHYRSYGIRLGLVGAAIGAVLGGLMGRGMTALYIQIFGIPDLVAAVHIPTVVIALAFGAGAGALASIAPSRTVMRLEPAEAMRGDAPVAGGKMSIFERVIPPLRNAPVRWRMTLRGIGRNKKRSATMIIGVVLAMTLILATAGMMDSMLRAMDLQFGEISREDATVVFEVLVTDDVLGEIAAVAGVAEVEPVIGLAATIAKSDKSFSTVMNGYERGTVMHGFPEALPVEGAFVGHAMADILDAEVGDVVRITFGDLDTTITTTIERFLDEPLGTVAYMSIEALENAIAAENPAVTSEVLASPAITTAQTQFNDGVTSSLVLSDIKEVDGVATAVDSTKLRETVDDFQAFFYAFIGLMMAFGGAMAFALIFNTISVNVAERSSEFASMRANGLTHRRVASLIAGENTILTAMGIVPGLIVGYLAAGAFLRSLADEQMPLQLWISPLTWVGTVVAMFVVAGLSLIPAVRAIKRINVGEIVRERSV
jgi:putative ABC transport system permease protein